MPPIPTSPASWSPASTPRPVDRSVDRYDARSRDWLDWVRAGLGVFGLFVALGVAVAILAFSAIPVGIEWLRHRRKRGGDAGSAPAATSDVEV